MIRDVWCSRTIIVRGAWIKPKSRIYGCCALLQPIQLGSFFAFLQAMACFAQLLADPASCAWVKRSSDE